MSDATQLHVGLAALTLFPGVSGGSGGYVRGLVDEFRAGHGPERVTLLANARVEAAYAGLVGGPVDLHRVQSYRAGSSDAGRLLAMLAARAAPRRAARDVPAGLDLVHYPVTVPIPAFAGPTVVTIHDVQHHDLPGAISRAERAFRGWAYDDAARRATMVHTPSAFARETLIAHVGVAPERVRAIHGGFDAGRFGPEAQPGDEARAAALGLPERFVLYPANLWPHKNHERLVEAFARAAIDDDVALVLCGDPRGGADRLAARAVALGAGGRVRHVGFVEHDTLPVLYRRATALVFPSLYEGFGTPPLEAMASGCPVAASSAGSLPEVVGDAALSFDATDVDAIAAAIERIVADAALRERLRAGGPAHAARFTWARAAREHLELYREAVGLAT